MAARDRGAGASRVPLCRGSDSSSARARAISSSAFSSASRSIARCASSVAVPICPSEASASGCLLLHKPAGLLARRLLLVGGGKSEKFTAAALRKAAGTALRHLKSKSSRDIAMLLDSGFSGPECVAAAVEGAILGDYEPDALKSDKNGVKIVDRFTVAVNPAFEWVATDIPITGTQVLGHGAEVRDGVLGA